MEKEKRDNPKIDPVNKEWLKAVLIQDVEEPKKWTTQEVDIIGAAKPKSRLQRHLQDVYEDLLNITKAGDVKIHERADGDQEIINIPHEDYFDKWYENNDINDYNMKYKLMTALNSLVTSTGRTGVNGYSEDDFQKILAKLSNAVLEEPDSIISIANAINKKYPGLAEAQLPLVDTDQLNEKEQLEYDKEVNKIRESVESNIDQYQDQINKIKEAAKTDFEEIAATLNRIVIFGEALWAIVLFAIMSPRAPRLIINSLDYRANLHMLLAGDISTAKSKILEICYLISPKALIVDETTKASLEGVAPLGAGDEIADGILDIANRGNIIVEELTSKFAKMSLWRRAMDCKFIQIFKKGIPKGMDVNSTMLTACNPDEDFFLEETIFREQLGFKEGVLSRFDILIPLTASTTSNKILVDKLNLFGEASVQIDLNKVKQRLQLIAAGMDNIQRVRITDLQLEMIRDAFKERNDADDRRHILRNRPFVLLRDLETLARFVNVIASVNFNKRILTEGVLLADDNDVDMAIRLWENLLHMRKQLYGGKSRILKSPADEIVMFIVHAQREYTNKEVPLIDVYREIVENQRLIGKTTFYKEVKKMRESGRIIQKGVNQAKVSVIIS